MKLFHENKLEIAARWFTRSQDKDFTQEDRSEMDAWLCQDPANEKAFSEIRQAWEEVACLNSIYSEKKIFCPEEHTEIGNRKKFLPRVFTGNLRFVIPFALAFVLIFVFFPFQTEFFEHHKKSISYQTETGEQKQLVLEDGSVLWLNVKTSISVQMSRKLRQVVLYQGETFFQVASDERRPFEIHTSKGLIRVLGTAFNVRERNGEVSVDVKQGRVQVSDSPQGSGDMRLKTVTLLADQGVDIGSDGRLIPVRTSRIHQVPAWQHGKVVFQNTPIQKVLEELQLYHQVTIQLNVHELKEKGISGAFDMRNLDQTLSLISMAASVQIYKKDNGCIVFENK